MSLFEKCKENIIDGRRVYVCSKVTGYVEIYNKLVVKFCSKWKITKYFPTLYFSLERKDPNKHLAYIHMEEVINGIAKIHVCLNNGIPNTFKEVEPYILHELTHLWQEYLNGYIKKYYQSGLRLSKTLNKMLQQELQDKYLFKIRQKLHLFAWQLQLEGLAVLVQGLSNGEIIFTEDYFLLSYRRALNEARKLNAIFSRLSGKFDVSLLKTEVANSLKQPQYAIGLHMVFSLLYFNSDLSLEKIAKMNHFTFVKKYEACMLKLNYTPAVSLTSRAGEFDYKQAVERWWNAVKE